MKKGIVFPCYNVEKNINVSNILAIISFYKPVHFCFVNNGSSDHTIRILEYISKESETEVSVLDIKKRKNKAGVIRSGERFLKSNKDLDCVMSITLDFSLGLEDLKMYLDSNVLQNPEFTDKTLNNINFIE
tara:strand:- start:347 stop:739 length:393 start_codon:yes stop_codon:yes gene_type:complete